MKKKLGMLLVAVGLVMAWGAYTTSLETYGWVAPISMLLISAAGGWMWYSDKGGMQPPMQ